MPGLTAKAVLHLQLPVDPSLELPLVTAILAGYKFIWDAREKGRVAEPIRLRGELELRAHILQRTQHRNAAVILTAMIDHFPT